VFKLLKHIGPKTKILFVAFILVLVPGAVISYLSLQSVRQKADNLRITYSGTVNLVRDKLENEVERLQSNLLNNIIEQPPGSVNADSLKKWIIKRESENPAFWNMFILDNEGGIITSSLSLEWSDMPGSPPLLITETNTFFNMAERAEFISKDYAESVRLYREALASVSSSRGRALIQSRIGRCCFKQGDYRKAIQEYEKIIAHGNNEVTIGNVPAQVVALSQIADSYEALGAYEEQYNATIRLYKLLLDRPWDLANGEYLYYLNSVSEKIRKSGLNVNDETLGENYIGDLFTREEKLLEKIRFIRLVDREILPEIETGLRQGSSSELQLQTISRELNDTIFKLDYFKLPATFQDQQLQVMGYHFDDDYILSSMFPGILAAVELGKEVIVGILGANDSLMYIQQNIPLQKYLVAEDFSRQFTDWKVALFDPGGRSIEQITGKEKLLYLILFAAIIAVMLIGIILMVRTVVREAEISRLKSEFVSNVSHELKTPLALIRMFGETLDSGMVKEDEDKRKFYSIIRKESERLTHLINNVLDFSRMDAGVKEYNFREEDLAETIRNSLEAYRYQISDSGFNIESELPAEPVILKIDRDAISQVLLNLLNNAVKYSDEEKYILVKVWKDSNSAMFSVTDHGVGIKKEEIRKIFDKFYRISAAATGEIRGSGLGLTLAQHIVEAHGGKIDVRSEVGEGSTFTVSIPLGGN
jgi:signal transduction histidine kinase